MQMVASQRICIKILFSALLIFYEGLPFAEILCYTDRELKCTKEAVMVVGNSETRLDGYDKVTGRTKYYEDRMPMNALYVRIRHADRAHAIVKRVDTSRAEAIPGVVKVLTCFDVPDLPFPTAGHPWSMDPGHQDVADRLLLNRHVRYWGDDVAVVIAEDEVAAAQGVRAIAVEYEDLPFVLDPQEAMQPGAPPLHEAFKARQLCGSDSGRWAITSRRLVRNADRAARAHRKSRLLCLHGKRAHCRRILNTDPAHHPPRRRAGARPSVGGYRNHQTVYRRRVWQQAGCPV